MWKKLTFSLVILAFAGLQMANSVKQCYTCATPGSCKKLIKQTCNNVTASATTNWLKGLNAKVPNVTNYNNFECMHLTYNVSKTRSSYLGCYYQQIPVCSLNLSVNTTYCRTCSSDLCNRNPAGTLSRSTNTIFATVVVLCIICIVYTVFKERELFNALLMFHVIQTFIGNSSESEQQSVLE